MATVISIGREMDPVFDSVTGLPVGISVGANQTSFASLVSGTTGTLPAATLVTAGGSTATFGPEGNLSVQVSATGVNPGATAADNVLAVYSIPASLFSAAGKQVTVTAVGSYAANGNTKTVKIIFNPTTAVVGSTVGTGGTTVATTGAVTTSGGGWSLTSTVTKYGAAGSNTQIGYGTGSTQTAPTTSTATESGAILVAVTGNAATTATDIVFNIMTVAVRN